ncbi:hypothetical protein AAG906_035815 [Vitis piasezkii]
MDIDYAIKKDKPTITNTSITAEKALYEQWERSNLLSVMFIKTKISTSICGFVNYRDNVKALLKAIDEQFAHLCEWCARAHNANKGHCNTIENT